MKKVLLVLISAVSLLAIACGASATKPEDLKEKTYEWRTGVDYEMTQITPNTPIYFDEFAYTNYGQNINWRLATDAKIIEVKSDNTQREVACTKDTSSGHLYSITPTENSVSTSKYYISYNYKEVSGIGTIVAQKAAIPNPVDLNMVLTYNNPNLKKGGYIYKVELFVYNPNNTSAVYTFDISGFMHANSYPSDYIYNGIPVKEGGVKIYYNMLSLFRTASGSSYSPQANDELTFKIYAY